MVEVEGNIPIYCFQIHNPQLSSFTYWHETQRQILPSPHPPPSLAPNTQPRPPNHRFPSHHLSPNFHPPLPPHNHTPRPLLRSGKITLKPRSLKFPSCRHYYFSHPTRVSFLLGDNPLSISKKKGLDIEFQSLGLNKGQQQALALVSAVLKKQGRKKGALVLDEVTGSVDLETENVMMSMIKREFAGWTVLAVVHRLETIKNYDKVVVPDKGEIVELGEPRVFFEMGRNSWFGRQILTLFKVNNFDLD